VPRQTSTGVDRKTTSLTRSGTTLAVREKETREQDDTICKPRQSEGTARTSVGSGASSALPGDRAEDTQPDVGHRLVFDRSLQPDPLGRRILGRGTSRRELSAGRFFKERDSVLQASMLLGFQRLRSVVIAFGLKAYVREAFTPLMQSCCAIVSPAPSGRTRCTVEFLGQRLRLHGRNFP